MEETNTSPFNGLHSCDTDGQLNIKSYKTHSPSMVQSSPNKREIRKKRDILIRRKCVMVKSLTKV